MGRNGPRWTGEVRLVTDVLTQPLHWKKPRRVFVNSMSDLFHEKLSDDDIDKVFAVMALAPQHTYQILTKRPERMRKYVTSLHGGRRNEMTQAVRLSDSRKGIKASTLALKNRWSFVWLGVSVENQVTVNERIPLLLETPAAVRFVSCEPLLGPIDLIGDCEVAGPVMVCYGYSYSTDYGTGTEWDEERYPGISWCIVGAESGHGARPMDEAWARSLKDQCSSAGISFFFKQNVDDRGRKISLPLLDGRQWAEFPEALSG